MMAPSWITTRKDMSQKSADTSSGTNWLSSSMCPVDEMGSHSVIPSTTPKSAALESSMMFKSLPPQDGKPSHYCASRASAYGTRPLSREKTHDRTTLPPVRGWDDGIERPDG